VFSRAGDLYVEVGSIRKVDLLVGDVSQLDVDDDFLLLLRPFEWRVSAVNRVYSAFAAICVIIIKRILELIVGPKSKSDLLISARLRNL